MVEGLRVGAAADPAEALRLAIRRQRLANGAIAGAIVATVAFGVMCLMVDDARRNLDWEVQAYFWGRMASVPLLTLVAVGVGTLLPGRSWRRAVGVYAVVMALGTFGNRNVFRDIARTRELQYERQRETCMTLLHSVEASAPLTGDSLRTRAQVAANTQQALRAAAAWSELTRRYDAVRPRGVGLEEEYGEAMRAALAARATWFRSLANLLWWLDKTWGTWEVVGNTPRENPARDGSILRYLNTLRDDEVAMKEAERRSEELAAKLPR